MAPSGVQNAFQNFNNGQGQLGSTAMTIPPAGCFIPVVVVSGATTLKAYQSGSLISVSQAAAYAITLPLPLVGTNFKFILNTIGANTVAITAASAATNIYGQTVDTAGGARITTGAGTNTVNFVNGAVVGDVINLVADGTNWYANNITAGAGVDITFV